MLLTKRTKQAPSMSRILRKAIMEKPQLKTKYYEINPPKYLKSYKKQKTFL